MRLSLSLRLMAREACGSSAKVMFFVACLSVGVAAVVAVAGLSDGIERALRREARQLLAADLSVSAERAIPEEVANAVDRMVAARPGSRALALRELATVVSAPGTENAPGPSALVLLKAAGDGYPFYGKLAIEPPEASSEPLGSGGAFVAPELASKLKLRTGSVLRIGGHDFAVRGVIVAEPDKVNVSFSLGPRVIISLEGFARTGLEGFGSRVDRKILVKLQDGADAAAAEAAAVEVRASIPETAGVRVQTYADAQPQLRENGRRNVDGEVVGRFQSTDGDQCDAADQSLAEHGTVADHSRVTLTVDHLRSRTRADQGMKA